MAHVNARRTTLDALELDLRASSPEVGARIIRIENGFRLQETDSYSVEVWKMLYNWRLVVVRPQQRIDASHGYCYYGTGLHSLARAVAAGLEWHDPLNSAPTGFDKRGF